MSKQKETWVFFSALAPFRGGISKFSMCVLKALQKQQKVKAFTFIKQYPNFLFPGSSQFDATVQTAHFERVASTFNPLTYLLAALRFRKENPAVFVTSYWMTFMAPMMVFWTWFLPKSTHKIAIIHNLNPHEKRFFDSFFNRLFLNAYDAFVVLSAAVETEVLALKPQAKVIVLPHPPYEAKPTTLSKEEACEALGLDPQKKTLLFFGLIRPYKGLSELIAAFELLDESYQLLIAGEVYGDPTVYHEALNKLPFNNWKFVSTYIPESDVATYFRAADLVVLPYLSATQSGVRALALSQQRAVLCTNVGGLAEGLSSNGHGFELYSTQSFEFASQLQRLFNQEDIQRCNEQLVLQKSNLDEAWSQFAKGLITLAERG